MNSGFLLIDKPTDWTSHDVVGYLRRVTGIKKIGHAGTLDPFATGLLIVAIGRESTKRIDEFKNLNKTYETTIRFGATSDTHDKTGTLTPDDPATQMPSENEIKDVLQQFIGKQQQIPPMYSAKKVQGKKLYELARKGIEIERQPNNIEIYNIELLTYNEDSIDIRCEVSVGTYIRTLAYDIGHKLGVGAYCQELRRTHIGDFSVDQAIGPKDITEKNWQSQIFNT